jgi:hypothetical protein
MGNDEALNRHVEWVFNPSRKDHHWERRKPARDRRWTEFCAVSSHVVSVACPSNQGGPPTTTVVDCVAGYLKSNLDASFVSRFGDETGTLPPIVTGAPERLGLWLGTFVRVFRLEQFSQQLPF